MSYSISNNEITLTRGDTLEADITLQKGEDPYVIQEGDSIRFALKTKKMKADKSDYEEATPLIVKEIPTDSMKLVLEPGDTKQLPFGDYEYDIQVTLASGKVDTVIPAQKFKLTKEVD